MSIQIPTFEPAHSTRVLPEIQKGFFPAPYILHDFFAGRGTTRPGFGHGWSCTFANGIDPRKVQAYIANFGEKEMVAGDVTMLKTRDIPDRADVAWASFPCTDLSVAGAGAGIDAERTGAVWAFLDLMGALLQEGRGPRMICLENVTAMLNDRHVAGFQRLVMKLQSLGYLVGAVQMQASHWVPQSRERLFIVASYVPFSATAHVSRPDDFWHPSRLRAAVDRMPEGARKAWAWLTMPKPTATVPTLSSVIEENPVDVRWDDPQATTRLVEAMSDRDRMFVEEVRRSGGIRHFCLNFRTRSAAGGKRVMAELNKVGIAGCIRPAKGGSSRQKILEIAHGKLRSRLMSGGEAKRLMGLPDGYKTPASLNRTLDVLGDGLVVPVVAHLVQHVLEPTLAADRAGTSGDTAPRLALSGENQQRAVS